MADNDNIDYGIFEELTNSSIYDDGHSEILFGTTLALDHDSDDVEYVNGEYVSGIHFLNGATVLPIEKLKHTIYRDKDSKRITTINFTLPTDDSKLSSVFDKIPYGIIKKNRTGVGATTLELKSQRNSIIVVPTRALALNKALSSRIGQTNKYRVLYYGGNVSNQKFPSLEEYLHDNEIKFKKFIVVIDSLPKLIRNLGDEVYSNYFIMYDEIDSLQDSSYYRDNIDKAFDYYNKFSIKNRCVVSATLFPFSNPILKNEPIINVEFNNSLTNTITLYPTIKPFEETRDIILRLLLQNPNDKIIIALNLLDDGILTIIESFPDDIKQKCGVLCSDTNKLKVEPYYTELYNGNLQKQITFMTSTYFVGIDIYESFHLICCQSVKHPFTLLSTEKILQISGRCRVVNGIKSEFIIYDWDKTESIDLKTLETELVNKAYNLIKFSNLLESVKYDFHTLYDSLNLTKNEIITASNQKYNNSDFITLLRLNEDGDVTTSYFNIDCILIQNYLRTHLYSSPLFLKNKMESEGFNIEYITPSTCNNLDSMVIAHEIVSEKSRATITTERDRIIQELRQTNIDKRKDVASLLSRNALPQNKLFFKRFCELCGYVEFEELISKLLLYLNPTKYKLFKNAVLIWALDDQHSIKSAIRDNFPVEKIMTGEELCAGFNAIYSGILGHRPVTQRQCFIHLKSIISLSSRTSIKKNGKVINGYRILSINPYDLSEHHLLVIDKIKDMRNLLKF